MMLTYTVREGPLGYQVHRGALMVARGFSTYLEASEYADRLMDLAFQDRVSSQSPIPLNPHK